MHFHLILVGIPSSLILSVKNRGEQDRGEHDKSYLSMVPYLVDNIRFMHYKLYLKREYLKNI